MRKVIAAQHVSILDGPDTAQFIVTVRMLINADLQTLGVILKQKNVLFRRGSK